MDKQSVLVVDDDALIVATLTQALEDEGYHVRTTVASLTVFLARAVQPAVILLDIMMPGIDGVEVRQRLRAHPETAGIPVIALSAAHNLRAYATAMGADDFLAKPFALDELLLRVHKWAQRAVRDASQASEASAQERAVQVAGMGPRRAIDWTYCNRALMSVDAECCLCGLLKARAELAAICPEGHICALCLDSIR